MTYDTVKQHTLKFNEELLIVEFVWVRGTGLAEPRFSTVKVKVAFDDDDEFSK